jgi:hypothetical protein
VGIRKDEDTGIKKAERIEYRVTDASRCMSGNLSAPANRGFPVSPRLKVSKGRDIWYRNVYCEQRHGRRKSLFPRHVLEAKNAIPEIAKSDA